MEISARLLPIVYMPLVQEDLNVDTFSHDFCHREMTSTLNIPVSECGNIAKAILNSFTLYLVPPKDLGTIIIHLGVLGTIHL